MRALLQRHLKLPVSRGSYASALVVALVAGALLVRLLLQPVFGQDHAYTAFYPAVILVSALAGRRAGLLATALSAVVAFWAFVEPNAGATSPAAVIAQAVFFCANAGVAVLLIAGLAEALDRISAEQRRAEAAAAQNADLFRELNERFTHHLHLVSGLLALQARGEPEKKVSDALAKASETSLMLARVHRDFSGRGDADIDFLPFARKLVEAKLRSAGLPPSTAELSGEPLQLAPAMATSLGVAVLECLSVLLDAGAPGVLHLEFARADAEVTLRAAELSVPGGARLIRLADGVLLRAVVDQLGARLSVAVDAAGAALEISFPVTAEPEATAGQASAATLH